MGIRRRVTRFIRFTIMISKRRNTMLRLIMCIVSLGILLLLLVDNTDSTDLNVRHYTMKKGERKSYTYEKGTYDLIASRNRIMHDISGYMYANNGLPGTPSNPQMFNYIHNERDACASDVTLLIYLQSAVGNIERRDMIRSSMNTSIRVATQTVVLFFLGASDNPKLMSDIRDESDIYHDIIQEDYIDTYRNLSLKVGSSLKWIANHCTNAMMVLKQDDDVITNIDKLINFIIHSLAIVYINTDRFMICHVLWSPIVQRNEIERVEYEKWNVDRSEFSPEKYPPYCPGNMVLISPAAALALYHAIPHTKFFWVDDVYLSGMLRQHAGVELVSLKDIDAKARVEYNWWLSRQVLRDAVFIFFPNGYAEKNLWKKIELDINTKASSIGTPFILIAITVILFICDTF